MITFNSKHLCHHHPALMPFGFHRQHRIIPIIATNYCNGTVTALTCKMLYFNIWKTNSQSLIGSNTGKYHTHTHFELKILHSNVMLHNFLPYSNKQDNIQRISGNGHTDYGRLKINHPNVRLRGGKSPNYGYLEYYDRNTGGNNGGWKVLCDPWESWNISVNNAF